MSKRQAEEEQGYDYEKQKNVNDREPSVLGRCGTNSTGHFNWQIVKDADCVPDDRAYK